MGGSGNLSKAVNTINVNSQDYTTDAFTVSVSGDAGFFVSDRFAAGIKISYSKNKSKQRDLLGLNTNENKLEFGPQLRYYFLRTDKPFNVLIDVNYQYGFWWFDPEKGNINKLGASAGSVIFFNTSVGMECMFGYYLRKQKLINGSKTSSNQEGFQMEVGLHFYLEKRE